MSDSDLDSETVPIRKKKRRGAGSDDDSSFSLNERPPGERRHRRVLKRSRGEVFSPKANQGVTADDAIQIISDDEANEQTSARKSEQAITAPSFIEVRRNPLKIIWKVPKVLWGGKISGFDTDCEPMVVTLMKEAFEFKSSHDTTMGLCVNLADRVRPFDDIACNLVHSPYFIAFKPHRGASSLQTVNANTNSKFDPRYIVLFFEPVDERKAPEIIQSMAKLSAKIQTRQLNAEDLEIYDNVHPRPRRGRTRAATQKKLMYDPSLTGSILAERMPILQYPIRVTSGNRITLTEDDFDVLEPENFLNDSIVDFYLLYLRDQNSCDRFHIFNSFFYKRYTSAGAAPQAGQADSYKAVKNWTRNVDLFTKDFLIMPVCDKMHWSCVIACYPGLLGERKEIDPEAPTFPCLLLLDSLGSHSGPKLFRMFRNYLTSEWKHRHPKSADSDEVLEELRVTKDNMPGYIVQVPQQTNDCDCGLFMLHYIEEFLANPFKDLRKPHVHNPTWFDPEVVVKEKRDAIRKVVLELSEQWKASLGPQTAEERVKLSADIPSTGSADAENFLVADAEKINVDADSFSVDAGNVQAVAAKTLDMVDEGIRADVENAPTASVQSLHLDVEEIRTDLDSVPAADVEKLQADVEVIRMDAESVPSADAEKLHTDAQNLEINIEMLQTDGTENLEIDENLNADDNNLNFGASVDGRDACDRISYVDDVQAQDHAADTPLCLKHVCGDEDVRAPIAEDGSCSYKSPSVIHGRIVVTLQEDESETWGTVVELNANVPIDIRND